MKKLFYLFAFLLLGVSANAQIPFITNENTLKALTLDEIHGTGEKPWGWWASGSSSKPRATLIYEHVADRYEKDEDGPKAAKFIARMNGEECTWHINACISSGSDSWKVNEDYSPIEIELETDFYFTFWAKAEVEGSTFHLGTIQVWNPSDFIGENVGWAKMPEIKLTTNWTKYAIKVSAEQTKWENWLGAEDAVLDQFRVHFRTDIDLYLDDIEIYLGDELPDDVGNYFIDGVEYEAEPVGPDPGTPDSITDEKVESFRITSVDNGVIINSKGGNLTVYNVFGQVVLQQSIEAGNSLVPLEGSSIYIAVLEDGTRTVTKKFLNN